MPSPAGGNGTLAWSAQRDTSGLKNGQHKNEGQKLAGLYRQQHNVRAPRGIEIAVTGRCTFRLCVPGRRSVTSGQIIAPVRPAEPWAKRIIESGLAPTPGLACASRTIATPDPPRRGRALAQTC